MISRIIVFLLLCNVQLFAQGYASLSTDSNGFIDTTGKIVAPHIYDIIHPHVEGLAPAYRNSNYGFLDTLGQEVIPFEYSTALHFKNRKAIVSKNLIFGVINKKNEAIIPFKYNRLGTHDHTTYHFQLKPQQSGLMDANEKILVPPDYLLMLKKNDSLWVATSGEPYDDYEFTIYKNDGSLHLPHTFQQVGGLNKVNLIKVKLEGKIGFLDRHYQLVIPPTYTNDGPELGHSIAVHNGKKWGFIDSTNSIVIPFKYDKVKQLSLDKCIVTINEEKNIINKEGVFLLANNCQEIKRVSSSDLIIIDSIVYDKNLNKMLAEKASFEYFPRVENGFLHFVVNGKHGYLNAMGNVVIPPIYEEAYPFYKDGISIVKQAGKWGFIDTTNLAIAKIEYDSIIHIGSPPQFSNFIILKNKKYGYFSNKKVMVQPTYDEIISTRNYSLVYRTKDKYGILNKNGQQVTDALYDEIDSDLMGFHVRIGEKYGFIEGESYEMNIPPKYDAIRNMEQFHLPIQSLNPSNTINLNYRIARVI